MTSRPQAAPTLLLIGAGDGLYRGYALKALAARYRILLLDDDPPSWQQPYLTDHRVADLGDLAVLREAADDLAAAYEVGGVLGWNEFAVVHTASIAQHLQTPGLAPAAALACRNKAAAHALFDAHGVPSARWAPVGDLAQLRMAAVHLGYPLVLKPVAPAGSAGVIRIDGPDQLEQAYAFTAHAADQHGVTTAGLLAEEYLAGPEISVEVVAVPGHHTVAAVTHKQLGAPPYFEITGHLVAPDLRASTTDEADTTAVRALQALDITHGVAHVGIRLTSTGPRIIDVTPCLGGDLIPHLVHLATGIDLVTAAADLAMGLVPDVRSTRHQAAGIGFVYPQTAGHLRSLTTDAALAARTWCERAVLEQQPGAEVAPPPASGRDSRLAHVVVTADTPARCRSRLDRGLAGVHAVIETAPADDEAVAA